MIAVVLPFFALVLFGFLAARSRVLPEAAIPGLNAYVLFFALPAMLYRFGATTPLGDWVDPTVIAVYLASALLLLFFAVAVTWGPRLGLKDAAFGALVAAFPNSGFMGVPLLLALLGAQAAGPLIATLLIDMFITTSVALAVATAVPERGAPAGDGQPTGWAARLRLLRAPLSNPMPWAVATGALVGALGWVLPKPLERVIGMLADSASPVALFTIGAVLWRAGQHAHSRTPVDQVLPVALIKLLLHPLLVLLLGITARQLGAPLSAFTLTVLVLVAALPSASNVSMLAERHHADNSRVARIIMTSTVLGFFTFNAVAWLLGVRGA